MAELDSSRYVCVADFEKMAGQIIPKMALDFYCGGADDEMTLQDNVQAFNRYQLRPRLLRDVSTRDMTVTILGHKLPHPIVIAPTSFHKMAHDGGEIATVKGAAMTSTSMCVSGSGAAVTLEEMAKAVKYSPTPLWIQFYFYKNKDLYQRLVRRAERAGYKALIVTVDLPYVGKRRADIRNNFNVPSHLSIANIKGEEEAIGVYTKGAGSCIDNFVKDFNPSLSWKDIEWIRSITNMPIVLKGILTAEDAKLAVEHGVDGILVSNHGGRQLDGVMATIDALPEVVEAVKGSKVEVYLDGGVRKGTDVLKALALGAKAVFIGRPVIWGLACNGQDGVKQVLDILKNELSLAMALSGCSSIQDVTRDLLQRRKQFTARL